MPALRVHKKAFEDIDTLGIRVKGAYEGTVTDDGLLVADRHLLFNDHFVRKPARETATALVRQTNGVTDLYSQQEARQRLRDAQREATHEGQLLGHIAPVPALRVKAERLAGIRYRAKKKGRWRYVWVDAHRLRLLTELFRRPLRLLCASWDRAAVLKRGERTVGYLMPAARHQLDIEVKR